MVSKGRQGASATRAGARRRRRAGAAALDSAAGSRSLVEFPGGESGAGRRPWRDERLRQTVGGLRRFFVQDILDTPGFPDIQTTKASEALPTGKCFLFYILFTIQRRHSFFYTSLLPWRGRLADRGVPRSVFRKDERSPGRECPFSSARPEGPLWANHPVGAQGQIVLSFSALPRTVAPAPLPVPGSVLIRPPIPL